MMKKKASVAPGLVKKGDRKDWKPDTVEIIDEREALRYIFKCDQWLGMKKGRSLFIDLPAIRDGKQTLNYKSYQVDVKTSDITGAGTDSNVYLCLFGQYGDSGDLWLEKSETHSDPFERNHVDKFTMQLVDLGEIGKCRLWTDNKGIGAAWNCEYVEVSCKVKDLRKVWRFDSGAWFSSSKDDKQISRFIECSSVKVLDSKGNAVEQEQAAELEALSLDSVKSAQPGDIVYTVKITTADEKNAGTNNTVWLILVGQKTHSRPFLMQSEAEVKYFSRGQVDTF
ncbi:Lipoxygenase y domain-containing protein 1, partial [Cichlidogyrus casuarinus]